jgi:hypothetical protein
MSDYKGRSLAFCLDITGRTLPSAVSAKQWINEHGDLLSMDEDVPKGAVLFWSGGKWGYCAVSIGNDLVLDSEKGVLRTNIPVIAWGYVYKGWVKP